MMSDTEFTVWMRMFGLEMLTQQFFEEELDCSGKILVDSAQGLDLCPAGLPLGDGTCGDLEPEAVDAYFETYDDESE